MELNQLTRKELASMLYDIYLARGIVGYQGGCGKATWIKRLLKGCGSSKYYLKEDLIKCLNNNGVY